MIQKIKEIMKMPFGKAIKKKGFNYTYNPADTIKISFYVPSSKVDEFDFMKENANKNLRVPNESDSNRLQVPAIILLFKGNGKWLTYAGQRLERLDFGKVSSMFGECYCHVAKSPMRFKRDSCRVLIHK